MHSAVFQDIHTQYPLKHGAAPPADSTAETQYPEQAVKYTVAPLLANHRRDAELIHLN